MSMHDPSDRQNAESNYIIDVTDACYDEIRKKLVALGNGGTIVELPNRRLIDMHNVTIRAKGRQGSVATKNPISSSNG